MPWERVTKGFLINTISCSGAAPNNKNDKLPVYPFSSKRPGTAEFVLSLNDILLFFFFHLSSFEKRHFQTHVLHVNIFFPTLRFAGVLKCSAVSSS